MNDLVKFLDGKKTVLAILAWVALRIFGGESAPDWIEPAIQGLFGVGVTHKFSKAFEKK